MPLSLAGAMTSGRGAAGVNRNSPDGGCLEQAVHSLSVAMKELHSELRDKTAECEAIYETANALSSALKESERLLAEKSLECERLELKVQMVTFREVDDDPRTLLVEENSTSAAGDSSTKDIIEEAEEMLARSSLRRADTNAPTNASCKDEAAASAAAAPAISDSENMASIASKKLTMGGTTTGTSNTSKTPVGEVSHNESYPASVSGPVSVDDEYSDDDSSTASTASSFTRQPAEVRQAHFYHVIQERDKAIQTVKKLSKEVKYARKKNEELKSRLERSTVLNELAYLKESSKQDATSKICSPTRKKRNVKNNSPQLSSQAPPQTLPGEHAEFQLGFSASNSKSRPHVARQLSWLRRGKEEPEETVLSSFPKDVIPLGKSAVAEQEYLNAIALNDADRAAGCDFARTVL